MTTTRRVVPLLVTTCLLGLAAAPASGQTTHEHTVIPADQLLKAKVLLEQAIALEASPDRKDWLKAADLRVESADLRPCADPMIFPLLYEAANTYAVNGRLAKAEGIASRAAFHAMAMGDVEKAAEGYLALAWIAEREGDPVSVHDYLARAQDLAESPLLAPEKAEKLRSRIIDRVHGGG